MEACNSKTTYLFYLDITVARALIIYMSKNGIPFFLDNTTI